ncbi:MAG: hypothetical protein RR626_00920 [Anaerovoracaceae bacterium]
MRTFNSFLACITSALFIYHSLSMSLFLMGMLPFSPIRKQLGWVLLALMLVHGVISLLLMIRTGGRYSYVKENFGVHLQRILGILAVCLLPLHLGAFGHFDPTLGKYVITTPTAGMFLIQSLFTLVYVIHFMISTPKIMVSAGIITDERRKKGFFIGGTLFGLAVGVLAISAFGIYCF